MKLMKNQLLKKFFPEHLSKEEEIKEKVKFLLNQWVSLAEFDKAESTKKLEEAKALINDLKQIQKN